MTCTRRPPASSSRHATLGRPRRAGVGDPGLADAIKKLRRPTVSAWLANLLARRCPDDVARLLQLGQSLRQAQQGLAGDELRRLSGERNDMVISLNRQAQALAGGAGQPVTLRELQETLEAASADPEAAVALRAGTLTSALHYSGFGFGDLGAATIPAHEQPRQRARRGSAPHEDAARARARKEAEASAAGARREAARTRRVSEAAQRELSQVRHRLERAEVDLERARMEVDRLRAAEDGAARRARDATSACRAAEAAAADAAAAFRRSV